MNTNTKKIIITSSLLIILIFEILLIFNNYTDIEITRKTQIYLNLLSLFLLLFSIILTITIKTKKEIVEIVKEKIIYKDSKSEQNDLTNKENNNDKLRLSETVSELLKNKKTQTTEQFISVICKKFEYVQAIAYAKNNDTFEPIAKYAYFADDEPPTFKEGNGLLGQTVKNKKQFILNDIPDGYLEIKSGLGTGKPKEILMQPIIYKNDVIGIIEFASFKEFNDFEKKVLNEISNKINKLN